jgi:GNAT superfamily N-acetyltransferase
MYEEKVGIRAISYHYENIDLISWSIELYLTGEEYELTHHNSPFGGKKIGDADVYLFDANKKSPFSLRIDANIQTNFSQFQILNSVRIFQDEFDLEMWEEDNYLIDEGELDYTDFEPDELKSLRSWTEYDEDKTVDVYGRLVLLDRIKILPEFRNKGYGSLVMKQLIQYFSKLGMDFFLLMPYPTEGNYEEDSHFREEQITRLTNFYTNVGFAITRGKLKELHCMVKRINC